MRGGFLSNGDRLALLVAIFVMVMVGCFVSASVGPPGIGAQRLTERYGPALGSIIAGGVVGVLLVGGLAGLWAWSGGNRPPTTTDPATFDERADAFLPKVEHLLGAPKFAAKIEALTAAEAYEARGDRERQAAIVDALVEALGIALAVDGRGRKDRTRKGVAAAIAKIRSIAGEHTPFVKEMEAEWKRWMEDYRP